MVQAPQISVQLPTPQKFKTLKTVIMLHDYSAAFRKKYSAISNPESVISPMASIHILFASV
jgi:hypothetical protein